jgi:hypothetical protein
VLSVFTNVEAPIQLRRFLMVRIPEGLTCIRIDDADIHDSTTFKAFRILMMGTDGGFYWTQIVYNAVYENSVRKAFSRLKPMMHVKKFFTAESVIPCTTA